MAAKQEDFDERRHPRDEDGRFVRSHLGADQRVVHALRQQADVLAGVEQDRTQWRAELARIRQEMETLAPQGDTPAERQAAVAEMRTAPDGQPYLTPGRQLRRHEELIRQAGAAVDAEIQARIGPPPEEVTEGSAITRMKMRELAGLAERRAILERGAGEAAPDRDDPALREIDRRLMAAQAGVARHTADAVAARSLYSARYTFELAELLARERSMGGTLRVGPHPSSGPARAVAAVTDHFPTDWLEAANARRPALAVNPEFQQRGFYDPATGEMGLADVPEEIAEGHLAVAVHETTHHLVAANEALILDEWAFFHRRVAGADGHPQPPVPVRDLTGNVGYDKDETCSPDHFFNPYIGRTYSNGALGSVFEILPVGIESLHTGDNGIYEDGDYRTFVVGALVVE